MSYIDDDSDSPEYVYDDMSSLRRFYCDVYLNYTQPADIVMSFEDLLRAQGMIDDSSSLEAMRKQLFAIADTSISAEHMREQFILLPFEIMTGYVEQTCEIEVQKAWYKDAVSHAKGWLKPNHTELCIEELNSGAHSCVNSQNCPLVVIYNQLVDGVCSSDFESVAYIIDPQGAYETARMKLDVAVSYGLISIKAARFHKDQYDKLFREKFPELSTVTIPQEQDE